MALKGKLIEAMTLTPLQEQFALYIVMEGNIAAAARHVGISVRTAHRWYRLPLVATKIDECSQQAFLSGQKVLEQSTFAAANFVLGVMNAPEVKISDRLRAAALLLEHGTEAHKYLTLDARIAEIERQLKLNQIIVSSEDE